MRHHKLMNPCAALLLSFLVGGTFAAEKKTETPSVQTVESKAVSALAEKDYPLAEEYFREALSLDPKSETSLRGMVTMAVSRGDTEVIAEFAPALVSVCKSDCALGAADALFSAGYKPEALDAVSARFGEAPDRAQSEWMAAKRLEAGMWGPARAVAEKGLEKWPDSWRLLSVLSASSAQSGMTEKAQSAMSSATEAGAPEEITSKLSTLIEAAKKRDKPEVASGSK